MALSKASACKASCQPAVTGACIRAPPTAAAATGRGSLLSVLDWTVYCTVVVMNEGLGGRGCLMLYIPLPSPFCHFEDKHSLQVLSSKIQTKLQFSSLVFDASSDPTLPSACGVE